MQLICPPDSSSQCSAEATLSLNEEESNYNIHTFIFSFVAFGGSILVDKLDLIWNLRSPCETYILISTYWMDGDVGMWVIDEEIDCQQVTGNFEFAGRRIYVWQAKGTSRKKL